MRSRSSRAAWSRRRAPSARLRKKPSLPAAATRPPPGSRREIVGWVERSETHLVFVETMGFAPLNPSYGPISDFGDARSAMDPGEPGGIRPGPGAAWFVAEG